MTAKKYLIILVAVQCLVLWLGTIAQDTCSTNGLQCSQNCSFAIYCTGTQPIYVRKCSDSTFCELVDGIPQCTGKSCSTTKPMCFDRGAIPSPTNCTSYYICASETDPDPEEFPCDPGQYYDPKSSGCIEGVCDRDPVSCNQPGDIGRIDSDTYCYYCNENNFPQVIKCDGLSLPDTTTEDNSSTATTETTTTEDTTPTETTPDDSTTTETTTEDTTPTETTQTDTTTTETTTEDTTPTETTQTDTTTTETTTEDTTPTETTQTDTTTTETTTTEDTTPTETTPDDSTTTETTTEDTTPTETTTMAPIPECTTIGQKFPYPSDCHKYYYCFNNAGAPIVASCAKGFYYDASRFTCVKGECENSGPTSTTSAPNPSQCTAAGQKFPNFEDCKRYLYCPSSSGSPVNASCAQKFCYDPTRLSCVLGDCDSTNVCVPTLLFDT